MHHFCGASRANFINTNVDVKVFLQYSLDMRLKWAVTVQFTGAFPLSIIRTAVNTQVMLAP